MKDNMLEVGDEIYSQERYHGRSILGKIERTTKTMAFTGNYRFRRLSNNGSRIDKVGDDSWSRISYYFLSSEEIREDIKKEKDRANKERTFSAWGGNNINRSIRELSDSKLDRIISILQEEEPKK